MECALSIEISFSVTKSFLRRFLLADLHIDSLSFKANKTGFREALEVLPNTSDAFYVKTLERINAQEEDFLLLAFVVLSWISYTHRPMKMVELRYAVAMSLKSDCTPISEDDLYDEAIISSCAGLLRLHEETEEVAFIRE